MKTNLLKSLGVVSMILTCHLGMAQSSNVDVNLNIKHSVGGVSDFGRERHITMHGSIYENDWEGEVDKAEFLFNELDVKLGRDNGTATFLFNFSPEDEENRNHHDSDSLTVLLDFWKGEYTRRLVDRNLNQFKNQSTGMIMGTNPHPTYPTLSYFDNGLSGSQWGRDNGFIWMPRDIETSAEWMIQYMDDFFVNNLSEEGVLMPEYWEVINEPDFPLNTGQFMMSSWEDIFEYHNLVAQGVKQRLGSRAPKIGGMTWGQHDLFNRDGISRFQSVDYVDRFYGDTPADQVAIAYARGQVDTPTFAQNFDWFQWDVIWKGFMNTAAENMDFYAVHLYDWPSYNAPAGSGIRRSGGHVEATLEMLEWYDVAKFGKNNRKPIVISEYGSVNNAWDELPHDRRFDWENLKSFSSMMMQFLERPDHIELSMPFTPIKAEFGDIDRNGDGIPEVFYHYKMLRDDDSDGVWEYSDFIKWYQLFDDVEGTRVDTMSSDPDVLVDSYVQGNEVFLILNNLEDEDTTINLNFFEDNNNQPESVRIKQLFLEGVRNVTLSDNTTSTIPSSITLQGDATMVLRYTFPNNVAVNQTSVEKKFYGEAVSPNQRVDIQNGDNTFFVNGVDIPQDPNRAEALLKITANLFDAPDDDPNGFLSINKLTFNGVEVETPIDWRGTQQMRSRWFGALEIPIPANLIQANNTITVDFRHVGQVCVVNLLTWDFSKAPGRSNGTAPAPIVNVAGVTVAPANLSLNVGDTGNLSSTITPVNATNQLIIWSSSNTAVATVDGAGAVTAVAAGSTVITATTSDGDFTDTSNVTVTSTNVAVTGVNVTPASASLVIGSTRALSASILPANASNTNVTWSSNNTSVASVNANGVVTALAAGSATITARTASGNFPDTSVITVTQPTNGGGGGNGNSLVIEAENFITTGGTINDSEFGGSGIGVNARSTTINYVNSGDYAEYSINVAEAGTYSIEYLISTPSDNAQIQFVVDGTLASTTNVPNNGDWEVYGPLNAANTVTLSAGAHTIRVNASGSNFWQWNLDKITLTNQGGSTPVAVDGGTLSGGPFTFTVGDGIADNIQQGAISLQGNTGTESRWIITDESGTILGLPPTPSAVNFEPAGVGTCLVWHISSDGVVGGLSPDGNINSLSGNYDLSNSISVIRNAVITGGNATLVIEAESFNNTGGTNNDAEFGGSGLGVNRRDTTVNYVNAGDFAEYSLNVATAGTYSIEYLISTPSDNAQIQFVVDGTLASTTNVPNNGDWEAYGSLTASGTVNLSAGAHTIRINASGTNFWQWNLDKITLTTGASAKALAIDDNITIYPNPAIDIIYLSGTEAYNEATIYDLNGSAISSINLNTSSSFDVSQLSNGVYIIKLSGSNNALQVYKVVVNH